MRGTWKEGAGERREGAKETKEFDRFFYRFAANSNNVEVGKSVETGDRDGQRCRTSSWM